DEETFAALRANRAALCIADADNELDIPFVSTADWGYLRLRREEYSPAGLKSWMKKIQSQEWESVFVFFKHEDEGTGPKLAAQFLKLAGSESAKASSGKKRKAK
ncbi:MAG: DUF72 domain-containing protein, partial [Terriglobia bacterium]